MPNPTRALLSPSPPSDVSSPTIADSLLMPPPTAASEPFYRPNAGDTLGNLVFAATLAPDEQRGILEQVRDAHSKMRTLDFSTGTIQHCEECGTLSPGNPCRTSFIAARALEGPRDAVVREENVLLRAIVAILDYHHSWRPAGEDDDQCWECGWLYPCTTVQIVREG